MSPHLFTCENTVRHGFPYKPISVAFDPIQVKKLTNFRINFLDFCTDP